MGEIKKVTFEIDAKGRFILKDAKEGQLFLAEVHKNPRLEILIGPDTLPNLLVNCEFKPPVPNKAGCPNEDCPYVPDIKLTVATQQERKRIVDEQYPD